MPGKVLGTGHYTRRLFSLISFVLSVTFPIGTSHADTIIQGSAGLYSLLPESQSGQLQITGAASFRIDFVAGLNPGEVPIFVGNQFVGTVITPGAVSQPQMTGFSYVEYPGIPVPMHYTAFFSEMADHAIGVRQPVTTDFLSAIEGGGISPPFTSDIFGAGSLAEPMEFSPSPPLGMFHGTSDLLSTSLDAGLSRILEDNGLDPTVTGIPTFTGAFLHGENVEILFSNSVGTSGRNVTSTPEPGSFFLVGSGLVGLWGWLRRRPRNRELEG